MVDVGGKGVSEREATASGRVLMAAGTLALIRGGGGHEGGHGGGQGEGLKKGDVLAAARIAGIQAAKQCWQLIPLCHPLPLSYVAVEFGIDEAVGDSEAGGAAEAAGAGKAAGDGKAALHIRATCRVEGRTGVEMEALTAVSVAALTVYDMCKAVDKDMCISDILLEEKRGGRSGDYKRPKPC